MMTGIAATGILNFYYLLNTTNNIMNITISHICLMVENMKSDCFCDYNDMQYAIL